MMPSTTRTSLTRVLPLLLSLAAAAVVPACARMGSASVGVAGPPAGGAGNACDRKLITKTDVAGLVSEPIATVAPLQGDPQSCVFTTTNFSSVTVSLRPGVGDMTVEAWLSGKMNVEAVPAPGAGEKAAWTPILKELNASHRNLLCDIGATGPASAAATQEKIIALCNKIFAAT